MRQAYIKAVHVARLARGAETAQQRRQLQQQQQQQQQGVSSTACHLAPALASPHSAQQKQIATIHSLNGTMTKCLWPGLEHVTHQDEQAGPASLMTQVSAGSMLRGGLSLGKPPLFRKRPSSDGLGPGHSMHSSVVSKSAAVSASAGSHAQPLSRRPSTVANHAPSRHMHPPLALSQTKRPAIVGCVLLQASRHGHASASFKARMANSTGAEASAAVGSSHIIHSSAVTAAGFMMPLSPLGKSLVTAELGSLDSALQHRSQIPPEQIWYAALSAADHGHLQESEQARFSRLSIPDSPRHCHTCLTANSMLAFAEGELTTSNESSPFLSPRPPTRAVDHVPGIKARCAVAESDSAGVTPRLVVHPRDIGVGRFEVRVLRKPGRGAACLQGVLCIRPLHARRTGSQQKYPQHQWGVR